MAEATRIEWCDHTFNPWEGCQKVAPECDNCYAETRDKRFTGGIHWGPKAPRRRTSPQNWNKPRRWNTQADAFRATNGRRQRVFCASLADVFDNAVDPAWRDDLWALIRACDKMDWLLLTKRPQNIATMLPEDWGQGWPHVWLGTSAGSQKTAEQTVPALLAAPAARRFLSCEPMLGPVDLENIHQPNGWFLDALGLYVDREACGLADDPLAAAMLDEGLRSGHAVAPTRPRLDWVICGGESGPRARPMHPAWVRSLRDQCADAGVPFFFKQWGEWADCTEEYPITRFPPEDLVFTESGEVLGHGQPIHGGQVDPCWRQRGAAWMCRVGKADAGRLLDGSEWSEFPDSAGGGDG